MGGTSKQFGIDEEMISEIIDKTKSYTNVRIEGLHFYMDTQILDEKMLIDNFKNILMFSYLAQNIELPILEEGDFIAILKSGAYGLTASVTGLISHPKPAEVLIKNKHIYLIRRRGRKEDLIEVA